jgi:hypothetical protein
MHKSQAAIEAMKNDSTSENQGVGALTRGAAYYGGEQNG